MSNGKGGGNENKIISWHFYSQCFFWYFKTYAAIASVNHIDSLVSWNFKHIVSINPIRKIHEINKKLGYQEILIGSLEIFGGYKYGNL